jgi:hypothetical protein
MAQPEEIGRKQRAARLYPNECVERVEAFIPPGHMHMRLVLRLCDQTIILHEAAVAGIVRAYAHVALHPTRRAARLVARRLARRERKLSYAPWQLVEDETVDEDAILKEALAVWEEAVPPTVNPSREEGAGGGGG